MTSFTVSLSAVGSMVLHFLWQGCAIGVVAAVVLACVPRRSSTVRYAVACAAMGACVLVCAVTFAFSLAATTALSAGNPVVALDLSAVIPSIQPPMSLAAFPLFVDGAAWFWACGVVIFAARTARQVRSARRLVTASTCEPSDSWQRVFDALRQELGVGRAVRLVRSGLAETPMVVGWISPVVLVPVSAFTSLTPDQLRAVLVHELAHIRRYDHLVNAAQIVVEVLLFYHPVVWWLSTQVRAEREHCCDDVAVRAAACPRIFAEALAQLETLRLTHPRAALAANGGPLMERIERVLGTNNARRGRSLRWEGVLALAAGAAVITAAALAQTAPPRATDEGGAASSLRESKRVGHGDKTVSVKGTGKEDHARTSDGEKAAQMEARLLQESEKIEAQVASGAMTREEANAKRLELKQDAADRAAKKSGPRMSEAEKAAQMQARLLAESVKIEAQVASGAMTREEADDKYLELREKLAGHANKQPRAKNRSAEKGSSDSEKIEARVASGEMTREEADAKYLELRGSPTGSTGK